MFNEKRLENRKQRTGAYHFCSLFSIHCSLVTLFVLFLSFTGNAQSSNFRTWELGWEPWKTDTTYYDSTGVIKTISRIKMKSKSLGSTTKIYKQKLVFFNTDGNWYFKERSRRNAGCFHFRSITFWKRTRDKYTPVEEQI